MGKKKKQTEPVPEPAPAEETKPTVINVNAGPKLDIWKIAFVILAGCWALSGVKGCAANIHQKYTDWKQSVIDRIVPAPPVPEPFKRERKTRPDGNDQENDRGIIWRFLRGTSAGAKSLSVWIRENVPKDASPKTVYDVADAFYDAADKIAAEPAIDTPEEAVAAARQGIYAAADSSWVPFLQGLDQQANAFKVESIDDVITFYYAVAGALYDAAAVPGAAAPSEAEESDRLPPSGQNALQPPAEPAVPGTDCPGGNCPNQAPRYNYGYNYGWRWY